MCILRNLATNGLSVDFSDLQGDGPGAWHRAVVDRVDGAYFRGCAYTEDLFGNIEVGTSKIALHHFIAEVFQNLNNAPLRDAFKSSSRQWRRNDFAVAYNEQVFTGALAHKTFVVQLDGFVVTGPQRFNLCKR